MDFSFGNFQNRGPMPDLQVGSRLQVEVVKKERDNYIIRSVSGPGVFHGMMYLGHWVHEQQPAYSNNSMVNIYSNMCHPNFQMSKSVQREPLTVGQHPQHLVDLTNGQRAEKQQQIVVQQQPQQRVPQMPPPTATDTLSMIKKNKRKNFIPCGIPSSAAVNTGFLNTMDPRININGPASSHQNMLGNLSNGTSDLREGSFDKDFLRACTEYVSRMKKVEVDMPNLLSGSGGIFDVQQGKKSSVPQKQVPAKRKEVTFAPFKMPPSLPSGSGVRQNGNAFPVNLPVRNGTSVPTILPRAAAGTANFVNVTPLNIMPSMQVVPADKVKPMTTDERNAIQREAATAQSGAEELAILLGCEKLAAEARAATAAAAAQRKEAEERSETSNTETGTAPVFGTPSVMPVIGNSCVSTVPGNSCATSAPGNSDSAPVPGNSATVSPLRENPELISAPDNSTKERPAENSPEKENAGNSRNEDSESPKGSPNDSRIVVKISLVNYTPSGASNASTASTAEAKPSPSPSTSSSSTKRSVADLRCPPEIAKSFEEEEVVRRSDLTGCPPMMPRGPKFSDEQTEGSDEEEKESKKSKKSTKKKVPKKAVKEEQPEEEYVANEAVDIPQEPEQILGMPGFPLSMPEKGENPQNLETGDVVWAKNGSEPYWPGSIFQFTRIDGVAGAVITWFGVDTFTPFVPLTKVDPFAEKYAQRFNLKRGDKKYQKGVARGIHQSKAPVDSFRNNMTKFIYDILVNLYNYHLGPFEVPKKRKRKSAGPGLKKKKLALSAFNDAADSQAGESSGLQEDESHFDEDDYVSVEDSSGMPEDDLETEPVGGSVSSGHRVTEPSSSSVSPHKSEDSGRTSPRSPIL